MKRKICPSYQEPHSHVERLVLDSFDARVLAFLYEALSLPRYDTVQQVAAALSLCTPARFHELVQKVYKAAFSPRVRYSDPDQLEANERKSRMARLAPSDQKAKKARREDADIRPTGTEERVNHIRFIHIVETYKLLCHAIK